MWFVEDVCEGPPAKIIFGGDDVGVDAEGVGEVPLTEGQRSRVKINLKEQSVQVFSEYDI